MDLKNIDLYDLSVEELYNIIKDENLKIDYCSWHMLRNLLILIIERNLEQYEDTKK